MSTPARDHEVLLVQGSVDREGEKGLAKRCEGGPAECQGVERTLGSTGLAPSHTKCVTLGKFQSSVMIEWADNTSFAVLLSTLARVKSEGLGCPSGREA